MSLGTATVDRYWNTLRHLRPAQFYGRLWFRLVRPQPNMATAPALRRVEGKWQAPARREASVLGPDEFLFLGELGSLSVVGWDGPQREKLWRYHQHYFDDLNAVDSNTRTEWHRTLLEDWVLRTRPGRGNGWDPYPTSLRIVNWVKWAQAGNALPDTYIHSLAVQARWLAQRLEIHLLGNHLFANAKALVFAGLYFEGNEAQHWLTTGLRILSREVPEQVMTDGGHFERSTMYHALVLEDMLDVCNLFGAYPNGLGPVQRKLIAGWPERVTKMQEWLHAMCHPDGEIAFFNDAAFGMAPSVVELDAYAARLGFAPAGAASSLVRLEASGYLRLAIGEAVAMLDVAPIGPDYLPGHGHADTLTFELSLYGHRVIVNSGTSCYGVSAERIRQRGTAAHNTVVVNGQDSSEVWSGFRVARRARPLDLDVQANGHLQVRCAHDGYRRLPGRPTHERQWRLSDCGLTVEDTVVGPHELAEARFHFHPQVTLAPDADINSGEGMLPDGRRFAWVVEEGEARIEATTWHPRFGASLPNRCLVVRLQHARSCLRLSWA
jgi:uncharacterized heparinase superfamily protein